MKAYASNFEMAQNSNCSVSLEFQLDIIITCQNLEMAHFLSSKTPRWLKIRIEIGFEAKMIRILSHLRVFELKKVSHLKVLTRDGYFDFLSHLKVPPVVPNTFEIFLKCVFVAQSFILN